MALDHDGEIQVSRVICDQLDVLHVCIAATSSSEPFGSIHAERTTRYMSSKNTRTASILQASSCPPNGKAVGYPRLPQLPQSRTLPALGSSITPLPKRPRLNPYVAM